MVDKNCVICGKNIKTGQKNSDKELMCLKCLSDYGSWDKFLSGKSGSAAPDIIENSSPLEQGFLLRLVIFAGLSFAVFTLSLLPFENLSVFGWLIGAFLSLLVILPLVFKKSNPLYRKRAENFFWPFIIASLFSGLILGKAGFLNFAPVFVSVPLGFITGFIWIIIDDKKLKKECLQVYRYYIDKNPRPVK